MKKGRDSCQRIRNLTQIDLCLVSLLQLANGFAQFVVYFIIGDCLSHHAGHVVNENRAITTLGGVAAVAQVICFRWTFLLHRWSRYLMMVSLSRLTMTQT